MKKILTTVCILLFCVTAYVAYDLRTNFYICPFDGLSRNVDNMPLVEEEPYEVSAQPPVEERGTIVAKWLKTGVKINAKGCSGSGTIIYYDPKSGYAYVQSCGHLWSGGAKAGECDVKCTVTTWYHNENKLSEPKTYPAEVIYYSQTKGQDCSLSRFKPDWTPDYYPIASVNFVFEKGAMLHSVGCDGGREIAHYGVKVVGMRGDPWPDLVTVQNSPRPGRSGGGLMSDDGYYVGICWGTSDYSGTGNGYFTPLSTIRYMNKANGYDWINDVGTSLARQIPIVDHNNPPGHYPPDYIPLPREGEK
jgi:hypothetical protein